MLVKELMIREVVSISPLASLRDALSKMKKHNVKSLVVEKSKEHDAYGLITYTNIIKTLMAESGDIDLLNVYDLYCKPVISVGPSLEIKHVAKMMVTHRIKRVLVLTDNHLEGIISKSDLIEELLKEVE